MGIVRTVCVFSLLLGLPALAEEAKRNSDDVRLEFEVGGGVTSRTDLSPTLSGRLGVDLWGWFTPSIRLISVGPWTPATSAWAIQGELRAHTRGFFQITGGIGFGLATANVARDAQVFDADLTRAAQPWLTGDVGARLVFGPLFVGASVGGAPFQQRWLFSANVGLIAF
jgi:hypothetical protein